jgi:signal transduction histidine kinase/DNA-binding LacI/PurR family transcriptional regulator/AraC-like DNA-binding protein
MTPGKPRPLHVPHSSRPTIGFLLASLHTGASRALWPGLLDAAEQHDANLIIFPGGRLRASNASEDQRNLIFDLAGEACLDGLVTWASSLGGVLGPGETRAFHQRYRSLPMVSLAQFMEGVPTVSVDSYHGMRALLTHLIEVHDYRRLAFIRGPEEHYYAQERYRAYLDTLQACDLPLIPELVTRPLRWESGAEAIHILLDERGLRPGIDFQAIVAVSDMLALWAQKTLQSRSFQIPGDVAITGFNNSIEERLATPPLTTVDLPFYHQGARSLEVLLSQLSGAPVPALLTLPSNLVVRQSCGCPSTAVARAMAAPEASPSENSREECLAGMAACLDTGDETISAGLESVFEAFQFALKHAVPNQFVATLENILDQFMRAGQDIHPWQDVLSALRRFALAGSSPDERITIETILSQARVVVGEAAQRAQSYRLWQAERQTENLRETNRALLTAFDVGQLTDVLVERLPGLGIPSVYLALYEQPFEHLEFARLVLASTEDGRAPLEPGGRRFRVEQLIPPDLLPRRRRYSLVVEPLYFQEKSIGYAVFEVGPREGDIYELLRNTLSSALQGAMLFQEIQQARLAAEKADHIKTRLLANVSHELRTPLNIILGYTQNMLQGDDRPLEPALQNEIEHIQNHAEHQLRVINDLLDLSRAEIDELDLSLELIDPHPLLVETFHSIADQDDGHKLDWHLSLPERLPLIQADPLRLRQILLNLLSNARKFTESGQIVLGAEVAPPHVHFWVSDTGWGIPPDQQERIFEPFVTIEKAHDRRISGGIGLGLSITRHLVALHGGRMTLDSQTGRGSTFHIYIPLPALEHPRTSTENARPILLLISGAGQPAAEIGAMAARQGLEIVQVRQAEELEAALAAGRPLSVAWDLSEARAGDWSLVRRLRIHPGLSLCPFIVYGQRPGADPACDAPALGLTGFVVKSPQPQTLLDAIQALAPAVPAGPVLIVDDDPQVREAHRTLVDQGLSGCPIVLAEDGQQALKAMEREVPALVLLDLVMPGLSGADVLDRMRADPRLRQVPVIVLSNKLLGLDDVRRIEQHAHVTLQTKGMWTDAESIEALGRALSGSDALPAHTSALVKRALGYLHQNYARPLARWEIAEAVGVSEDYLTRLFNRELGLSPWDYLNRYRILQAKHLLKSSTASIGAIARQVGFKDQTYFSRVFSKLTGQTPQTFRES